jgi:hypothetical protein
MRDGVDNNADGWYCDNCGSLNYHMTTLIIYNICNKDLCPQRSSSHSHNKPNNPQRKSNINI